MRTESVTFGTLSALAVGVGALALVACGGPGKALAPPIDGGFPVSSAAGYPYALDGGVIDPRAVEIQLFNEYVSFTDLCSSEPTFTPGIEGYLFFVYSPTSVDVGTYPFGLFYTDLDAGLASQGEMSVLLPDGGAVNTLGTGTVTVTLFNTVKIVGTIDYQFVDDGGNVLKTLNTDFTVPLCPNER